MKTLLRPLTLALLLGYAVSGQDASSAQRDQIHSVLQGMYEAQQAGRSAEALALLTKAENMVSALDPAIEGFSSLLQQVVGVYQSRGHSLKAERLLQSNIDRLSARKNAQPTLLEVLEAQGVFFMSERQENKAIAIFEKVMSVSEKLPGEEHRLPMVATHLARLYEARGRTSEAEALLVKQRALAATHSQAPNPFFGRPGPQRIPANRSSSARMFNSPPGADDMVGFLVRQGKLAEAEKLLRAEVDAVGSRTGAPLQQQLMPQQALSRFLQQQARWEEASAIERAIYERYKQSTNPQDQSQALYQLSSLGHVSERAGRHEDAEKAFQQMLESSLTLTSDPTNSTRLHALSNYARWLLQRQRTGEAEKIVQQYTELALHQPQWAQDQAAYLRADVLMSKGDIEGANRIRTEVQNRVTGEPRESAVLAGPTLQRAFSALHASKLDDALALAEQAVASMDHAVDRDTIPATLGSFGVELARKGGVESADVLFERAHARFLPYASSHPNSVLGFQHTYFQYLVERKRFEDARKMMEERRQLIVLSKGTDAAQLEETFLAEIDLVRGQGTPEKALEPALALLSHQERLHGEFSEPVLRAAETLAEVYAGLGDLPKALEYRHRALEVGKRVLPATDARRAMLLANLAADEHRSGLREQAIEHLEQAIATAPATAEQYRHQLQEFRKDQNAPPVPAPGASRWFDTDHFSRTDGTRLGAPRTDSSTQ